VGKSADLPLQKSKPTEGGRPSRGGGDDFYHSFFFNERRRMGKRKGPFNRMRGKEKKKKEKPSR